MRVLITNLSLSSRSGTETYTRDLALELLRRGHEPSMYSPILGDMADELRADGVQIVSSLDNEPAPDVIHGHHHTETMSAVLRFPGVPAVFVCHDRTAWHDRPPRHPRIRAHVAVDENCRARFVEEGFDSGAVFVVPNAVDLTRFRPRDPLPVRPKRALLFSNYASEHTHLPAVRTACERAGLELDVAGSASGNPCARPEELLRNYDLVFAKARCALEAMAVGCAVVLCDSLGAGPLVRSEAWAELRPLNFGRLACPNSLTPENLLNEVVRYDAADAAEVCRITRERAGIEHTTDALLALYDEAIRTQAAAAPEAEAEARAAAEYLRANFPYQALNAGVDRDHWRVSAEAAHRGWAELQRECDALRAACEAAHRGWAELQTEYESTLAECRRRGDLLARRAA